MAPGSLKPRAHSIEPPGRARLGIRLDVLVVDDDAGYAETVANALRSKYPALKVEVARYSAEAIEKMREDDRPSLVLADCKMPVMDGRELGKVLKQSYGRSVKVVLMTESPVEGSTLLDGEGVVEKSVDLTALYSVVDNWFAGQWTTGVGDEMVHFNGQPKAARGKLGIVIPREAVAQGEIDPDEEYEIYLKKAKRQNVGDDE